MMRTLSFRRLKTQQSKKKTPPNSIPLQPDSFFEVAEPGIGGGRGYSDALAADALAANDDAAQVASRMGYEIPESTGEPCVVVDRPPHIFYYYYCCCLFFLPMHVRKRKKQCCL
jgi:hypothetical protein